MISSRCNACRKLIRTGNPDIARQLVDCSFHYVNTCNQCFTIADLQKELSFRARDDEDYENFLKILPKIIMKRRIERND